jgi:hypothetical protein
MFGIHCEIETSWSTERKNGKSLRDFGRLEAR